MRWNFAARAFVAAFLISAMGTGCATTSTGAARSTATSPQDRAHEDQLSAMQVEDGANARRSTKKVKPRRAPESNRRKGQGIVDQPIRR